MIAQMACAFFALFLFGFGAFNLAPVAFMAMKGMPTLTQDKDESVKVLLLTSLACFGLAIPLWYVLVNSIW